MFHVIDCGYNFVHENGIVIDRPAGVGCYVFVLHKSDADALLGGQQKRLRCGTCVLYGPQTPQYYRDAQKPFVNDWIHFDGDHAALFFDAITVPIGREIPVTCAPIISESILELQEICRRGGPYCKRLLDLELRSLFLKLRSMDCSPNISAAESRYFPELSALRNALYSAPKARVSAADLAAQMHLSKSYFQHLYRKTFGCSVLDDIIGGRLKHAEYLLRNSTAPISGISEMCGYQNVTHFMRQFRRATGMTPGDYRRASPYAGPFAETH